MGTKYASPLLLKRGLRAAPGEPMQVVIRIPTAPAISAEGFARGSSFPGPALLACVPDLLHAAVQHPEARLLLFGHATEAGGEEANKKLSDRRAQSMLAVMTQDIELFDKVAREDKWKLAHYQAMLVALGFAEVMVDGKRGPKTAKATRAFQRAYNAAEYHAHALRERAHAHLKVDGVLGERSEAALRDAYLALVRTKLDPARFFGPRTAGCGEFNRTGDESKDGPVVLTLYRPDFPTESRIPCKTGDAGSCKLNRGAEHPWKCNFYRRTLEAETAIPPKALPTRRKVLVQTVDEFGYRLPHQPLVFVDGSGIESHASTDADGVFDGHVQMRSEKLEVHTPDGRAITVLEGTFNQPVLIDIVVFGASPEPAQALQEQLFLSSVYDRTSPDVRREGRLFAAEGLGEPWSETSMRTETQ